MAQAPNIGVIRFASGPGCPCGGERMATYQKIHHCWRPVPGHVFQFPHACYLRVSLNGSYWQSSTPHSPFPPLDQTGDRVIQRKTGRPSGKKWDTFGDGTVQGMVENSISWGTISSQGTFDLSNPYGFGLLAADVVDLMVLPDLAAAWLPWGASALAGYAEVAPEADLWSGPSWLDGGSVTGKPGFAIQDRAFEWVDQPSQTAVVTSTFRWGLFLARQRLQSTALKGYFSLHDEWWSGYSDFPPRGRSRSPETYWFADSGIFEILSPEITVSDSEATSDGYVRRTVVTLGAQAPVGKPTNNWPMIVRAGVSC